LFFSLKLLWFEPRGQRSAQSFLNCCCGDDLNTVVERVRHFTYRSFVRSVGERYLRSEDSFTVLGLRSCSIIPKHTLKAIALLEGLGQGLPLLWPACSRAQQYNEAYIYLHFVNAGYYSVAAATIRVVNNGGAVLPQAPAAGLCIQHMAVTVRPV
jgi:hypothetical protein